MMQLFALAMNPNVTEDQFLELSKQVMDGKVRMMEVATAGIKAVPEEYRAQYVSTVIQLWLS